MCPAVLIHPCVSGLRVLRRQSWKLLYDSRMTKATVFYSHPSRISDSDVSLLFAFPLLPHLLFICLQLTCGLDPCERVWTAPFSRCSMALRSSCWSTTSGCSEPFSSLVSGRSNWRMDPISCINYAKTGEKCLFMLTFSCINWCLKWHHVLTQ